MASEDDLELQRERRLAAAFGREREFVSEQEVGGWGPRGRAAGAVRASCRAGRRCRRCRQPLLGAGIERAGVATAAAAPACPPFSCLQRAARRETTKQLVRALMAAADGDLGPLQAVLTAAETPDARLRVLPVRPAGRRQLHRWRSAMAHALLSGSAAALSPAELQQHGVDPDHAHRPSLPPSSAPQHLRQAEPRALQRLGADQQALATLAAWLEEAAGSGGEGVSLHAELLRLLARTPCEQRALEESGAGARGRLAAVVNLPSCRCVVPCVPRSHTGVVRPACACCYPTCSARQACAPWCAAAARCTLTPTSGG